MAIFKRFNLRGKHTGKFQKGGTLLKPRSISQVAKDRIKRHNPDGVAFGDGKKSKNVNIVPYARKSLSSTTGGVNAGLNVSKTHRVSSGFYFRVERRTPTKLEKGLKEADRKLFSGIAARIAPKQYQESTTHLLQAGRSKLVNKHITKQVKVIPVGRAGGYGRITTSRQGIPTLTVRAGKAKVSDEKRRKGIDSYNRAATKFKSNQPKKKRAARRKASSLSGVRIAP